MPPFVAVHTFNAARVEYMIRCLVQGRRAKVRSIRKRRLGLF
jgi:hypothetical protein